MIPLFKSSYSIGKSILPLESKKDEAHCKMTSILDIAIESKLNQVVLVEDSMLGFLKAYTLFKKNNIKLIFGLRTNFHTNNTDPKESIHKNILFLKRESGYKNLVKLASIAGKTPTNSVSYSEFSSRGEGIELVVPFYDSYIYNNLLQAHKNCIPEINMQEHKHFIERNNLPRDTDLEKAVRESVPEKNIVLTKSIFYCRKSDVIPFQARKLMENKSGRANTLDKPNLDGFASDEFCWESYMENNNV